MNNAQKIFETFTNSTDSKSVIDSAFEIKKYFSNITGKEPIDETGEELLYLIGGKKETFEWFLFLIIIYNKNAECEEYFKALSKFKKNLSVQQSKWANLILKEIKPQLNEICEEYCNDLIVIFDKISERELLEGKKEDVNKAHKEGVIFGFFNKIFGNKKVSETEKREGLTAPNNDSVDKNCDKVIEIIDMYGLAGFISFESSKALSNEIKTLKNNHDRSLATRLIALHEKNLTRYIETMNLSEEFIKFQRECINLLIEIEAYLYFQSIFVEALKKT